MNGCSEQPAFRLAVKMSENHRLLARSWDKPALTQPS